MVVVLQMKPLLSKVLLQLGLRDGVGLVPAGALGLGKLGALLVGPVSARLVACRD